MYRKQAWMAILIVISTVFVMNASTINPIKSSPINTSILKLQTFRLDSNSSKEDVFEMFKTISTTYEVEGSLTAYKTRAGKITVLGIIFKDKNSASTNLQITTDSGIPEVCILIDELQHAVAYAGSCEKQNQTRLKRDPAIQEARQQALYEKLERLKAKKKRQQELRENIPSQNSLSETVEKPSIIKPEKTVQTTIENRKTELRAQAVERRSQSELRLANAVKRRDSIMYARKALMEQKREEYRNRMKNQRNAIKTAPVKESIENNQTLTADQENTNAVIESVRKMQTNASKLDDNNVIFFSGEKCTYKVFDNRTFVYDTNNHTLLIINKPLGNSPSRGETVLKGVTYEFEFDGLSLSVKNDEGMLINKDGNLLNPLASFERGEVDERFQLTKEFTITAQSTASQIRSVIQELNRRGFNFLILENVSNPAGAISYFAFSIDGKSYSFRENTGIPVLSIKIDEPHHKARVQTAN